MVLGYFRILLIWASLVIMQVCLRPSISTGKQASTKWMHVSRMDWVCGKISILPITPSPQRGGRKNVRSFAYPTHCFCLLHIALLISSYHMFPQVTPIFSLRPRNSWHVLNILQANARAHWRQKWWRLDQEPTSSGIWLFLWPELKRFIAPWTQVFWKCTRWGKAAHQTKKSSYMKAKQKEEREQGIDEQGQSLFAGTSMCSIPEVQASDLLLFADFGGVEAQFLVFAALWRVLSFGAFHYCCLHIKLSWYLPCCGGFGISHAFVVCSCAKFPNFKVCWYLPHFGASSLKQALICSSLVAMCSLSWVSNFQYACICSTVQTLQIQFFPVFVMLKAGSDCAYLRRVGISCFLVGIYSTAKTLEFQIARSIHLFITCCFRSCKCGMLLAKLRAMFLWSETLEFWKTNPECKGEDCHGKMCVANVCQIIIHLICFIYYDVFSCKPFYSMSYLSISLLINFFTFHIYINM